MLYIFIVQFLHDPYQSQTTILPSSSETCQPSLIVAIRLDPLARCWHLMNALNLGYSFLVEFHRSTIVCSLCWFDY